eukprot:COSAG01_NODE_14830_length_1405_cov_1.331547_2_plen_372_part_00
MLAQYRLSRPVPRGAADDGEYWYLTPTPKHVPHPTAQSGRAPVVQGQIAAPRSGHGQRLYHTAPRGVRAGAALRELLARNLDASARLVPQKPRTRFETLRGYYDEVLPGAKTDTQVRAVLEAHAGSDAAWAELRKKLFERYGRAVSTKAASAGYTGSFRNGRRHGTGAFVWADGRRYHGSWRQGHRHGHGILRNPDGSKKYEGQWVDGCPSGRGRMWFRDHAAAAAAADTNTRQPVEPEPEPEELEASRDRTAGDAHPGAPRSCYEGTFSAGSMSGEGVWVSSDGAVSYEGGWLGGRPHGEGSLRFAESGVELRGSWREGRLHGSAKLSRPLEGEVMELQVSQLRARSAASRLAAYHTSPARAQRLRGGTH